MASVCVSTRRRCASFVTHDSLAFNSSGQLHAKAPAKPAEKTEAERIREEYAKWRKDHVNEYVEEHNLYSANDFCNSRKNVAHPSVSDLIQLFGPQWKVRCCASFSLSCRVIENVRSLFASLLVILGRHALSCSVLMPNSILSSQPAVADNCSCCHARTGLNSLYASVDMHAYVFLRDTS